MLPDITHLQFLVLMILLDEEKSGREVREELADNGVKKSGPAFYQMMSRLEDDKLVKGWYVEKMIDGQRIKERRYAITGTGTRAYADVQTFYAHAQRGLQGGFANA